MTLVKIAHNELSRRSTIQKYFSKDWQFEVTQLAVGDYICGNTIVEWKNKDIVDMKHLSRQAKAMIQQVNAFLQQDIYQKRTFKESIEGLKSLFSDG